jgi:hypothetical protein
MQVGGPYAAEPASTFQQDALTVTDLRIYRWNG